MPYVRVPQAWSPETGGTATVPVRAITVLEAPEDLTSQFPAVRKRVFTDNGSVASWVTVSLDGELVRPRAAATTEVAEDRTLLVIPAMAGG